MHYRIFAVVLFFLSWGIQAGEVTREEMTWGTAEGYLGDLIRDLQRQKDIGISIHKHLTQHSDNVFWSSGLKHAITAKEIVSRPYCNGCFSWWTWCFYKPCCLPLGCLKFLSCGYTGETESAIKIKADQNIDYNKVVDAEKAVQKFHNGDYRPKKRSLIIQAGTFDRSKDSSNASADEESGVVMFYQKSNREAKPIDWYVAFGSSASNDEFALAFEFAYTGSMQELQNKYSGKKYLQFLHSSDFKNWGEGFKRKKIQDEKYDKVKRVTLEGLELPNHVDTLGVQTHLIVNYYDQENKHVRTDSIDVLFAKSTGMNYGYRNLLNIQPGEYKATITIVCVELSRSLEILDKLAAILVVPIGIILKEDTSFTASNIINGIMEHINHKKAIAGNPQGGDLTMKAVSDVEEWLKEEREPKIIGGFSVDLTQLGLLENIDNNDDNDIKKILSDDSLEANLGLWIKK